MSTSMIIREFPVSGDADAAPVDRVPAGLPVSSARMGGPILIEYKVKFVDADGTEVVGGTIEAPSTGSATLQWHGIAFTSAEYNAARSTWPWPSKPSPAGPKVSTLAIDGSSSHTAGVARPLKVRGPVWPWPEFTAITPPTVLGKVVVVTFPLVTPDGTYSIQRDEEDPVEYAAVGTDWRTIIANLLAGFGDDEVVTVEANYDDRELTFTSAAGVDFDLTLVSPGDIVTQADDPVPEGMGVAVAVQVVGRVLGPLIE
jgi:hypothetical protein